MRHSVVRALVGGALALVLGGCGLLGNTDEVCADAKKAYEQYMTQVKSAAANDPAQWKKSTEALAVQVEGLSRKADDGELKKALKSEADGLRVAATSIGGGDAARLNSVITQTPTRIGKACD